MKTKIKTPPVNDPRAEWQGMPQYKSRDMLGIQKIIVHFRDRGDVTRFSRLLGQPITDKTRFLWFPKSEEIQRRGHCS